MKRLQLTALCVGIFAFGAFGVNQCASLIRLAEKAGVWRHLQINWNRSLAETGAELKTITDGLSSHQPMLDDSTTQQVIKATLESVSKKHTDASLEDMAE